MNILFICSRNKWRSLTAETIFQDHPIHKIRSAGTSPSARIKINHKLIEWAELIFVMEKRHKQIINERFADSLFNKMIVILNIPDEYQYMDEDLIGEIQRKVSSYF